MSTPIEQSLIDPNPYQPRGDMDPVALNRLAEDLKLNGLLQAPAVRPVMGGRYQLIFGHRRAAAWRIAHGDAPLPCEVREMDDRQMFAAAIVENDDREALNAIERARALQLYMTKFDSTQAAAAQLFGLKDQASVSNLLRLLRLPAGVQAHVATGDLPERYAREMIPLVEAVPEKSLVALADKISIAQTPGDAQAYLDSGLADLLRKHAPRLNAHPPHFPTDWEPGVSTTLDGVAATLKPCTSCKYRHTRQYTDYCLRAACHAAKSALYSLDRARSIAAEHKLQPAAVVQTGTPVVGDPKNRFDSQSADILAAALDKQHPGLRLMPVGREGGNGDYWRNKITGSEHVDVVLADGHTIASIAKDLGKKKPAAPSTPADDKAAAKESAAKEAELRHGYDQLKVNMKSTIVAMLPHFRGTLTITPAVGAKLLSREEFAVSEVLGQKYRKDLFAAINARKATQAQLVDALIAMILWDIAEEHSPSWFRDYKPNSPQHVRDALAQFAQVNKIKLPTGWDSRLVAPAPAPKPTKQAARK